METIYFKFQLNRIIIQHFMAFGKIEKIYNKNLGGNFFGPHKKGCGGAFIKI